MSQSLIYGLTGQVLRHVPPARVTSATYAIEDLTRDDEAADRIIASGSATIASWSATTTAIAGPTQANGRRMTVSSTTGAAIGDPAAIVAADGSAEIIEVAALATGAYLEARATLAGVYAAGSTVYGVGVSATVPDSLAADSDIFDQRRPLRVVWTYTIGSNTYKVQDLIVFTRHTGAVAVDVGAAVIKVQRLYPDLPSRLPDGADLDVIAGELVGAVEDDFRSRGHDPARKMLGPAGVELLAARIVAHAGDLGYAPGATDYIDGRWAKDAHKRYRTRLEALTVGEAGEAVIDTSVSDQATENPSRAYSGITLRM